jgi:hypothetical protein
MANNMDLMQMAMEDEDDEFVYFILANQNLDPPRGITYDHAWPRFNLADQTMFQYWNNFRFWKDDIVRLSVLLGLPEQITVRNGCTCSGVDALCMVLRRFAYPNRLCELEQFFGRPLSSLSMIINHTVDLLYNDHQHRLRTLDNPWFDPAQLQVYADAVHEKGAPLRNCIGFVDGHDQQILLEKIARDFP